MSIKKDSTLGTIELIFGDTVGTYKDEWGVRDVFRIDKIRLINKTRDDYKISVTDEDEKNFQSDLGDNADDIFDIALNDRLKSHPLIVHVSLTNKFGTGIHGT